MEFIRNKNTIQMTLYYLISRQHLKSILSTRQIQKSNLHKYCMSVVGGAEFTLNVKHVMSCIHQYQRNIKKYDMQRRLFDWLRAKAEHMTLLSKTKTLNTNRLLHGYVYNATNANKKLLSNHPQDTVSVLYARSNSILDF